MAAQPDRCGACGRVVPSDELYPINRPTIDGRPHPQYVCRFCEPHYLAWIEPTTKKTVWTRLEPKR